MTGEAPGRVYRLQLGGHPVDPEADPALADGDLPTLVHLQPGDSLGGQGLQHPKVRGATDKQHTMDHWKRRFSRTFSRNLPLSAPLEQMSNFEKTN